MMPIRLTLLSMIRHAFARNPLGLRKSGDTLNCRREWTTRDKILFALGQKWGRR